MEVRRLTTASELQSLPADRWSALAGGIPFRGPEWLAPWWASYGEDRELYTLAIEERGELLGLAPLYLQRSVAQGRVLRLLGDGEVCSDYLGLIGVGDRLREIASAVANWLCQAIRDPQHGWDALHLEGVDAEDSAFATFVEQLAERGCRVHRQNGPNCWRLELPETWSAYEAMLSKSHRKQVRRLLDRVLDRGRAKLHTVRDASQLQPARRILIDLHQRRRAALGEPGSFASAQFEEFHTQAMPRLFAAGMLRLHWLELDGQPAAAEYHLGQQGVVYCYQSGVAPELLDEEPGRLSNIATLQLALQQGYRAIDFLRGDEPYKAHFRAQPRPLLQYRIAPPRPAARIRHQAWTLRERAKDWWRAKNTSPLTTDH